MRKLSSRTGRCSVETRANLRLVVRFCKLGHEGVGEGLINPPSTLHVSLHSNIKRNATLIADSFRFFFIHIFFVTTEWLDQACRVVELYIDDLLKGKKILKSSVDTIGWFCTSDVIA